jgi:hypothetical protein
VKTLYNFISLLVFLLSSISDASDIYKKVSDLLDLSQCASTLTSPTSKCSKTQTNTANHTELRAISENQFYNELAVLEIERLQCSQQKSKSLQTSENILLLMSRINELAPQLKKLRTDINSLVGKNQILNGKIPKSVPPKPGTIEYQRKLEYDDRNEEVKSLMALESLLISQIPFSETSVIQDLIDQAVSKSGQLNESDVLTSLKKLDASFNNSVDKINQTKSKSNSNFDLSTDQKISIGTDEFLISQMIQKNPNNESEIKKLQCSSEKMKNGQQFISAAGTVASFAIPVGLASAGRLAFLMRAPLMAKKFTQISRVAGSASLLVGNIHGLENVFKACTKNIEAKVQSASGSEGTLSQCDYTSQTLTSDFNSSSCILNATLQLLPNAGSFLTRKIADRNSLLSKYIFDIQNSPSLKKLSQEDKEAFLKTAGSMTNAQRRASAAILAERSLSPLEKEGLIAAHKIAEGKGYFELSPSELREKMKKLKESGFLDDEADLILRSGLAGQVAKIKGGGTVLDTVEKMSDSANKSRLLAELKTNSIKPDVEASTALFKKSTTQYLEEIKSRGTAPSARELSEIEYVAARWASQTKDPKDLAAATKIYTDAMEKRFKTNGSGRDTGENVQGYLQMLQSDPGKGLHREASEWKRKTIIQYLNSKGWNLR